MLSSKELDKIIFFAIETVPMTENFSDLSPIMQECFKKRFDVNITKRALQFASLESEKEHTEIVYKEVAALHPEFGRISSISWGAFSDIKTYAFKANNTTLENEKEMLTVFADKMSKIERKGGSYPYSLCGFSAKGFNIPFLCKRILINQMQIPTCLDMENLKPWEQNHVIDLSSEWKMGSYESYVSLQTLCALFDLPFPQLQPEELSVNFYNKHYDIVSDNCDIKVAALTSLYLRLKNNNNKININN